MEFMVIFVLLEILRNVPIFCITFQTPKILTHFDFLLLVCGLFSRPYSAVCLNQMLTILVENT